MKTLNLLVLIVMVSLNTNAQLVTISATHQIPSVGDSVFYVNANTFGFDPAGVGPVTAKVWGFSTLMLTGDSSYFVFVDPNTISVHFGRDSFPSANIARAESGTNGYFYYENTSEKINRLGWYVDVNNYGIYKNGTYATEFKFPITAGQNFSSTYVGNMSAWGFGEDSVRISDGSISISADMQGQMILPVTSAFHTITYNNVLRIKVLESFRIKTYMMGHVAMNNLISDEYYYWFVDTIFQPLLVYGKTTIDGQQQEPVLKYQKFQGSTNIVSNNFNGPIIYPNPTKGLFYINFENNTSNVLKVEILNTLGQVIYQNSTLNSSKLTVDISSYSKGLYFVKAYYNNSNVFVSKITVE